MARPANAVVHIATAANPDETTIVTGVAGRSIVVTHLVVQTNGLGVRFQSGTDVICGRIIGGTSGVIDLHDDAGLFGTDPGDDLVLHAEGTIGTILGGCLVYHLE